MAHLSRPIQHLTKVLDSAPYQSIITNYAGLPLMRPTGDLFGILCHYDYEEQLIIDDAFSFLQQATVLMVPLL